MKTAQMKALTARAGPSKRAAHRSVRLVIASDYEELSRRSAQILVETIRRQPDAVVSLTTGRTMDGFYRCIRDLWCSGALDLSAIRVVSSEEYAGIGAEHPISLYGWMRKEMLDPCRISDGQVLRLDGDAPDLEGECRRFDRTLAEWGGIDLAVQTVGVNGHFGFNEPGAQRDSCSRTVLLTPATRAINGAYWPAGTHVPEQALTMGVAQILDARQILLLASGQSKAVALAHAWTGPIDEHVPCSLLRLAPNVTAMIDKEAAEGLGDISSSELAEGHV